MRSLAELRTHARNIFAAALAAVDPYTAIKTNVNLDGDHLRAGERSYDLRLFDNIFVAGCGKASARMALALEDLLGDRIAEGIVVVKYGHGIALKKIEIIEAGHPIPDGAGLDGARRVAELVRGSTERDLIFFLISGGGSALLPFPVDGLSLAEKQQTTEALLKSGATITEINALRKHLSRLKGGRLAGLAMPATTIALILSDVTGDVLDAIASGPTAPDNSAYESCLVIIDRYGLQEKIPAKVFNYLRSGAAGEHEETPKPGNPIFDKVQNLIVGSNRTALTAARARAAELGYRTMALAEPVEGESRIAAGRLAGLVRDLARDRPVNFPPLCIIAGGETTVTVRGNGVGGRNQEFALAAAVEISGLDNVVVLSGGTDGTDGPTDAAGGVVDGFSLARGNALGLAAEDFLDRNDSYAFLRATDDLLITGPTLTNVMDIQIMLIS
jgi:hydroxypyruvate reductase